MFGTRWRSPEGSRCPVLDFNTHFGAVPRPSATDIQSPGNWSLRRFDQNIADNDEFLRTCRFKWAFNIKPDLVVQTPSGRVLCIEAKWDSREGWYPASEAEKAIFRRRGIEEDRVSQTSVQRHLVDDLLGFDGTYWFLARTATATAAERCVTWRTVLGALDRSSAPAYIRNWCELEIGSTAG